MDSGFDDAANIRLAGWTESYHATTSYYRSMSKVFVTDLNIWIPGDLWLTVFAADESSSPGALSGCGLFFDPAGL